MQWVPAPKINMNRGLTTWEATSQRTSGTANVRTGAAPHRNYDLEWTITQGTDISFVDAALRGDYSEWFAASGVDPTTPAYRRGLFFLDPFAMSKNILPDWWASPGRVVRGGRRLMTGTVSNRTHPNPGPLLEPVQGVNYNVQAGAVFHEHPIPIPPGYTLHLGVRGSFFWTARLRVYSNDASASTTEVTLIDPSTTTLTNYTYANNTGATQWRTLTFGGTGDLTLYSALAVIVPNGTPAPTDKWVPGEGSGVLMPSGTNRVGMSAAIGYETLLTHLTEVDF